MNQSNNIYTYGVFDLFHFGHLVALKRAKALGDKLIIGVFTDRVAESFKRRPIVNQEDRIRLIRELDLGDAILQDTFEPTQEFLDNNEIKVVAKAEGAGWDVDDMPHWDNVQSFLIPYSNGISTSELINRIKCS